MLCTVPHLYTHIHYSYGFSPIERSADTVELSYLERYGRQLHNYTDDILPGRSISESFAVLAQATSVYSLHSTRHSRT